jgi:phytoene dehydrogenase-like protein
MNVQPLTSGEQTVMPTEYDAAIIGAGHNGLVAANYLGRAGLRVVVLERRSIVGGACVTEELIPGYRTSSCAFVAGLMRPQVMRDLELTRFGLELYQTDVLACSIFEDGSHFLLWRDLDRTLRELEQRFGRREVEAFIQFGMRLQKFARLVEPTLLAPPPTLSEFVRLFEEASAEDLFTEFVALSVSDLLDRYFESELIKGFLTFFAVVSVYGGPSTPGTAYVYGHHSWGEFDGQFGQYGFPRGGMGSIAEALAQGAQHFGAEIRTDAPVARVLVEKGEARGIVLENGEEIRSRAVLSNADPQRTFLSLVDSRELDSGFLDEVRALDFRGSMARVHVSIDELPHFVGFDPGEGPQHRGHIMLGASVERFEQAWEAERNGLLADDLVIEAIIQTVHDPALAPPGKHMIVTGVQQLPYDVAPSTWDELKPELSKKVIDTLCVYAPNLRDHVLDTYTITPLDLEREYGLTGGNIFQGAMTLNQLFGFRPLPGWSSYRSPIRNLYLCGAGTHPAGGVMGAPGHNAAKVVLRDRLVAPSPVLRPPRHAPQHAIDALAERMFASPLGRRISVELAQRRWFRPVLRLTTRRRGSS